MPHNQAGKVHAGYHFANVQNPRTQRPHPRLQPVRPLHRRRQVFRRSSHPAGPPAGRVLSIHIQEQGCVLKLVHGEHNFIKTLIIVVNTVNTFKL